LSRLNILSKRLNVMKMTVLIPTYRRPQDLERCLAAIQQQTRSADEILVIARDTDHPTWALLDALEIPHLRCLKVTVPGVIAALNLGLSQAQGDGVAITDDDAAPHADWLEKIEAHFCADPQLGGVGGRDWRYDGALLEQGEAAIVGQIQGFGRLIGNHHLGVGGAREVDMLKGVNMGFRKAAIENLRFDERLKGSGAQVHNELAFCLDVKRQGWKLVYDPAIAVDHYEGDRAEEDRVGYFNSSMTAVFNSSYNEALILLGYFSGIQNLIYLLWSFLIGTRQAPGMAQALRFMPQFGRLAWQRFWVTQQGKWLALRDGGRVSRSSPSCPISVVILTQNEALFIERCVRSVLWADEVVVLDSGSTDGTRELAIALGAQVYEQSWLGWSAQHSKAIRLAKHNWVLVLDADEIVTPELADSIQVAMAGAVDERDGYSVNRRGDFYGILLPNESRPSKRRNFVRLFNRKYSAHDPTMTVHEEVRFPGKAIPLDGILLHWRGYIMDEYIPVFNRYATAEAEVLYAKGDRANGWTIFIRPILRFLWCYVAKGGFRLGTRGLIHAQLKATSEYIRYTKLWEMEQAERVLHPPAEIYLDPIDLVNGGEQRHG
jgi:glycosyltransferase involved in cell wall biosynthesis